MAPVELLRAGEVTGVSKEEHRGPSVSHLTGTEDPSAAVNPESLPDAPRPCCELSPLVVGDQDKHSFTAQAVHLGRIHLWAGLDLMWFFFPHEIYIFRNIA